MSDPSNKDPIQITKSAEEIVAESKYALHQRFNHESFYKCLYELTDSGLVVFDVGRSARLITLDIDDKTEWDIWDGSDLVWFGGQVVDHLVTKSKSGNGCHVYLVMFNAIVPVQRAALAILAGSDKRREAWSATREAMDFNHGWCLAETPEEAEKVRNFLKKHGILHLEVRRPANQDTAENYDDIAF